MGTDDAEVLEVPPERVVTEARVLVRRVMERHGFSTMEITRVVTATSELARNMVKYAGGGQVRVSLLHDARRIGVCVAFTDRGPGIASLADAMRDGFSTGGGLGLGLPGASRLVDGFEIDSRPGTGTRIVIRQWKR
jgi:serine/threonine-protein kinase RsbT